MREEYQRERQAVGDNENTGKCELVIWKTELARLVYLVKSSEKNESGTEKRV